MVRKWTLLLATSHGKRSWYLHVARKMLYAYLFDVVLYRQLRYSLMDFSAFSETNSDWDSSEM